MNERDWEEWILLLSKERRDLAIAMHSKAIELGMAEPEEVVRVDLERDAPEMARQTFLRRIWTDYIRSWSHENISSYRVADDIITQGVNTDDIIKLAQMVAYETAFGILWLLDSGCEPKEGGVRGWRLVEIDDQDHPTGRVIDALHESILGADPTNNEGMDFLDEV